MATSRRKPWEQLSEKYRRSLERKGITPQIHAASGTALPDAARKRASRAAARAKSQQQAIDQWKQDFPRMYGVPSKEHLPGKPYVSPREYNAFIRRFDKMPLQQRYDIVRQQQEMQRLFLSGKFAEARRLWQTRDTSLPDWMFFYHGYFS